MGCCGWRGADQEPVHAPEATATEGVVARRRRAAQADLLAATGGEGLCPASGDTSGWDAELARGRAAALADVAAALRASPGRPLVLVARHVLCRWETEPRPGRDQAPGPGRRAGALDELRSLVAELTGARPGADDDDAVAPRGGQQRSGAQGSAHQRSVG